MSASPKAFATPKLPTFELPVGAGPRGPPPKPKRVAGDERAREQRVFRLVRGATEPVEITVGATDGVRTEVVAGELTLDDALVVSAAASKP